MEISIITKIDFFELMKTFFTDKEKWNKLTQSAKKPHFFLWRRMMSIQYPIQMNALAGLDDIRLMDVLQKNFCTGTYPRWMYTSSKDSKSKTKKSSLLQTFSRDVLDTFMDSYSFEWKSLLELDEFNSDFLRTELKLIDKELHPELTKQKQTKRKKNV